MNTRTLALVAIIAVAAVAVVGAGYAYYWGQTTINDNQVDVQYLSVQTDMEKLNVDVNFNTTYSNGSFTIEPTGSDFDSVDSKNVTPITRANDGTALGQEFILKAPIATAANSYDFQVKISGVTIGTNATLHFGISAAAATAPTALYEFYPTGTVGEYVAVLPANALVETESGSGIYQLSQFGFIYLEEADSDSEADHIQVEEINTIKCSIDSGSIEFQALIDDVAAISDVTAEGTITITSETDGFAITKCISMDTSVATVTNAGVVTKVAVGTTNIVVEITKDDDVFYRIVGVTFS